MKFRRDKGKVRSADVDTVLQLASGRSLVSYVNAAQDAVNEEVGAAQEVHDAAVEALRKASARQQVTFADLNVAQGRAAVVARVASAQ